jgi:hypothetical protein
MSEQSGGDSSALRFITEPNGAEKIKDTARKTQEITEKLVKNSSIFGSEQRVEAVSQEVLDVFNSSYSSVKGIEETANDPNKSDSQKTKATENLNILGNSTFRAINISFQGYSEGLITSQLTAEQIEDFLPEKMKGLGKYVVDADAKASEVDKKKIQETVILTDKERSQKNGFDKENSKTKEEIRILNWEKENLKISSDWYKGNDQYVKEGYQNLSRQKESIARDTDNTITDILSPLEDSNIPNGPRKQIVPFERLEKSKEKITYNGGFILKYSNGDQNVVHVDGVETVDYESQYDSKFFDKDGNLNLLRLTVNNDGSTTLRYIDGIKNINLNNSDYKIDPYSHESFLDEQDQHFSASRTETAANKFIEIYKTNSKLSENTSK